MMRYVVDVGVVYLFFTYLPISLISSSVRDVGSSVIL